MKLKEILDMEEYLQKKCYCPGEVYSADGFFYQIFNKDNEFEKIGENKEPYNFIAVISKSNSEKSKPQILIIWRNKSFTEIEDIVRYDATENNIGLVKEFIKGRVDKADFDEYEKGATEKSLKEIMNIADAIMIS